MLRLLVLDQSRILPWRVGREVPADVVLLPVAGVRQAERVLVDEPPDAAVVSLSPARIDWRSFQHLCATRCPPVPVLYESCLHRGAEELGLDSADGYAAFLSKPAPQSELRRALGELLDEARRTRLPQATAVSGPLRS